METQREVDRSVLEAREEFITAMSMGYKKCLETNEETPERWIRPQATLIPQQSTTLHSLLANSSPLGRDDRSLELYPMSLAPSPLV